MRSVIIVSGASSSLGIILCQDLVRQGYLVYAGYNSNPQKLNRSKYLIPIKLDITNTVGCKKVVARILEKEKTIYGLINLVAISPSGKSLDFNAQDFQNILDINVVGPFRLIKEVLPHLPPSGRIINIGSLSGLISFPSFSLYSASKFALRAFSLSLYFEWLPKKRFVTHIAPGAIAKDPPAPPPPGSARNRVPLLNWLLPLVSPHQVSEVIIGCLNNPSPPPEILIGIDTIVLSLVRRLSPEFVWSHFQNFVWKKQR